jgi:hypothetical protein
LPPSSSAWIVNVRDPAGSVTSALKALPPAAGVLRAAGAVVVGREVAGAVGRVVVIVEEVPAGDVVGEAVAVVVVVRPVRALHDQVRRFELAVAEGVDQVLRRDRTGRADPPAVGEADAWVRATRRAPPEAEPPAPAAREREAVATVR